MGCRDEDFRIWNDLGRVKRRLTELRGRNEPKEDVELWMNECLNWAAYDGQLQVCRLLLKEGGDLTWRHPNVWGYVIYVI